jgi:hypothetical protein
MFYRKVCLSLMEKNNNVDGKQEKHKLRRRSEQYAETRKLRKDSSFQKCRRGPRDGLAGGAKVETREHLENLLSQRDQKLRRRSDNGRWIEHCEESGPLDQSPDRRNECAREEQIPSVGSERKGPTTVRSSGFARRISSGGIHDNRQIELVEG